MHYLHPQSRESAKLGNTKTARNQGLIAAYLNVAAIIVAFVVALLVTGLTIGLYAPTYYLNQCREEHGRFFFYGDSDSMIYCLSFPIPSPR